jgi:hypothetical protein
VSRWWGRLAAVVLGLAVCEWTVAWQVYAPMLGVDLRIVTELGRRWAAVGTMYLPYQLAGPYSVAVTPDLSATPALYPPAAGPLLAPLHLVPPVLLYPLWWAVPVGLVAWSVRAWRPAPWTWPLMAACLAGPAVPGIAYAGGTSLWAAAAVAVGLRWRWPAALVLVKPTLGPFALVGVRSRWWWAGAAVVGALTLAGPWREYLAAGQNAYDTGGLLYSLGSAPLLLLPVVAWLGRSGRPGERPRGLRPRADARAGAGLRAVEVEDLDAGEGRPRGGTAVEDDRLDRRQGDAGAGDGRGARRGVGDDDLDEAARRAGRGGVEEDRGLPRLERDAAGHQEMSL